MTTSIANRKRIELEQKFSALDVEFTEWTRISQADQLFEKHHTQVLVVTTGLKGFAENIRSELEKARQPEEILTAARNLQALILAVRRIWEYFRSKWIQRLEVKFQDYLKAADELVWSFYEPVLRHRCPTPVSHCRREPPLVFLNGGLSPFALSRDQMFQAEEVVGQAIPDDRQLQNYLRQLPIAVIGIPWFQIRHLPDALVLAHETAHAVEDDFALHNEMAKRYAAVGPAWEAWEREVFADLFGCMVMGPPFLDSLMDFLAIGKSEIAAESRLAPNWGYYPTAALRILLCVAALKTELGFPVEAERLLAQWSAEYPGHAMPEYENCFQAIIAATFTQPINSFNCALIEVPGLKFEQHQMKEAVTTANSLASGSIPETVSVRVLFAAMRILFTADPAAIQMEAPEEANPVARPGQVSRKKAPTTVFFERFKQIVKPGTRAAEQPLDGKQLELLKKQSRELGIAMFEQVRNVH
jgi:hypothetical protein